MDDFDNLFDDILFDIEKYTKNLTVLYVEDNKEAREANVIMLNEFFENVILAVDGEDGLEKFKNNKIDLIISDINMPNMNGLIMFEKIREIDKDVKLVLLTAFNELEYYEAALKLNIDGYLLKPINLIPLLNVLDKVVTQLKLKEELEKTTNLLKQYQNAMDKNLIVSKTDLNGKIIYVNDRFIRTYGYTKEEILGNTHNILKSDQNDPKIFEEIWNTIKKEQQTWIGLIGNKTKDGHISYSKTTISPILDTKGNIIEYIALRQDVTEYI